jgi:RNA polymerase sigma-70 factor (ECF subfamily)
MTRKALEELMEAHQAELFRYLRFIGADYSMAEDLVQETYLCAFQSAKLPDLDNLRARRGWLRRIAHNRFIDQCRRRKRSPIRFSSEQADAAEIFWESEFYGHDEGFGCLEALEICLQKLSAKQRELIDAFYGARRSRDEIASGLGISSDGVKMALRRVRVALGECIQQRLSEA